MAEDTDFSSLYRELGIRGACTPEAFRRAYRRRVSQLHPDQRGAQGDVARLQELNRLYDAALDFLQLHGRLPGSAMSAAAVEPGPEHGAQAPAPDQRVPDWYDPPRRDTSVDFAAAGTRDLSRYFILLAVLAIAALAVSALNGMFSVTPPSQQATSEVGDAGISPAVLADVSLGMAKRQVRAIQGAPVGNHAVRWDYGPSWIDFGCGDVVTDWYSSPLRPLRTATPHPTPRDWDRFDAARPPGC